MLFHLLGNSLPDGAPFPCIPAWCSLGYFSGWIFHHSWGPPKLFSMIWWASYGWPILRATSPFLSSTSSVYLGHFLVGFFFPFCNQFIFQARCKFASMLSCLFWCQFFIVFVSQGFFYKMNLLFINLSSSFSLYIPQINFC